MDDKGEHWDEILQIVKSKHNERVTPVTELDAHRSEHLDKKVHAYIDQQFHSKDETEISGNKIIDTKNDIDRIENGFFARLSAAWRRLIPESLPAARALSVMTCALVAVVAISLLSKTDKSQQPYFDVPASLFTAGLGSHVQLSRGDTRALAAHTTPRSTAFLFGNVQAALDLFESSDNSKKLVLERLPVEGAWQESNTTSQQMLDDFAAQLETMMADERAQRWIKEGYMIEMVELAAKGALVDLKTDTLNDVLKYYRDQIDLAGWLSSEAENGLSRNYLYERLKLYSFNFDKTATPDELQQVIDVTGALKVLVN